MALETRPAALPTPRGKLTAHAPLAPLVWFKSGGAAQWLFEPKDADDLADFLRDLDPSVPVMAFGLGSNLIVRDGEAVVRRESHEQQADNSAAAASNAAAHNPPAATATSSTRYQALVSASV